MLAVYLLSELLTMAISRSMDTHAVGGVTARCILVAYAAILCSAAVLMQHCSTWLRLRRRLPQTSEVADSASSEHARADHALP